MFAVLLQSHATALHSKTAGRKLKSQVCNDALLKDVKQVGSYHIWHVKDQRVSAVDRCGR